MSSFSTAVAGFLGQARKLFARGLALDLRSLALFRMGAAGCILGDLAVRAPDLRAHYTDEGILPRDVAVEISNPWQLSLHLANGLFSFQLALFIVAALVAVLLLLGIQTRLACAASWFLLVSLENRNFIILNGADVFLRMLLFWGMFLPLGERFSVDSLLRPRRPGEPNAFISLGSVFFLLQIVIVYLFSGLCKFKTPAWQSGDGFAYALRSVEFSWGWSDWVVRHVEFTRTANYAVMFGQVFGSLLFLVPALRWAALARMFAVAAFLFFHLSSLFLLSVGAFPFVGMAALSALAPPEIWDRFASSERSPQERRSSRVSSACHHVRTLVADMAKRLPPPPATARSRFRRGLRAVFATVCFLSVACKNVGDQFPALAAPLAQRIEWSWALLGLDQQWAMFSQPLTAGGWYVVPARLESGAEVDLLTGGAPGWETPSAIPDTYPNARWKKYLMNIAAPSWTKHRLLYGRYLCRSWNAEHRGTDTLEAFKIYYMVQTVEPWREPSTPQRTMLWEHECSEGLLAKWRSVL